MAAPKSEGIRSTIDVAPKTPPTLTGAYQPAQQVNNNVGPVSITFQGSENAIMTLPGGRTTAIRRFRF